MKFTEVLNELTPDGEQLFGKIPDSWRQGRTAYGGISTALVYEAARRMSGETRALRSAMVNFVGPAFEDYTVEATTLRSGRTAAAVRATMKCNDVPANETVFTFSDLRPESSLKIPGPKPQPYPLPTDEDERIPLNGVGPVFISNYEMAPMGGKPFRGDTEAHLTCWARHRDEQAHDSIAGIISLADVLAPAATRTLSEPAPMSSMTWMINMLVDNPTTEDGWWMVHTRADNAKGGFSSQDMYVWNAKGQCVMTGRQMVTIFA